MTSFEEYHESQMELIEGIQQAQTTPANPFAERPITQQVPMLNEFWQAGQARRAAPAEAPTERNHRPTTCPWEGIGSNMQLAHSRPFEETGWHLGEGSSGNLAQGPPSLSVDLNSFA